MDGSIKELIKTLDDPARGWVARRDAAEALGKMALEAVTALSSHRKDKDMDVLVAVESCLETLQALIQQREKPRKYYSLRELAMACAKKGVREVEEYETGYSSIVTLSNGRSQRLYIMRYKSKDGRDMVRLITLCGKSNKDYEHWALKLNRKFSDGAFALQKWNGTEYLALVNNIMRKEATPELVKRCVKAMAEYGDWIEEKMEGTDEL